MKYRADVETSGGPSSHPFFACIRFVVFPFLLSESLQQAKNLVTNFNLTS